MLQFERKMKNMTKTNLVLADLLPLFMNKQLHENDLIYAIIPIDNANIRKRLFGTTLGQYKEDKYQLYVSNNQLKYKGNTLGHYHSIDCLRTPIEYIPANEIHYLLSTNNQENREKTVWIKKENEQLLLTNQKPDESCLFTNQEIKENPILSSMENKLYYHIPEKQPFLVKNHENIQKIKQENRLILQQALSKIEKNCDLYKYEIALLLAYGLFSENTYINEFKDHHIRAEYHVLFGDESNTLELQLINEQLSTLLVWDREALKNICRKEG